MKRLIHYFTTLLCAIVLISGASPSTVSAISVNYWRVFDQQINIYMHEDDPVEYTMLRIPNIEDYCTGKDELGNPLSFIVPADVFEKWVHTFFYITDQELHDLLENYISENWFSYDANSNTYSYPGGGKGGGYAWSVASYLENKDGTYTLYVQEYDHHHEPLKTLEELYKEFPLAYQANKEDIVWVKRFNNDWNSYEWIQKRWKVEIGFDGTYVQYRSAVEINSIPQIAGMITPDTPVDKPTTEPSVSSFSSKLTSPTFTQQPTSSTSASSVPTSQSTNTDITGISSMVSTTTENLNYPSLVDDDTHISIMGSIPDNATMSVKLISESEETYKSIQEKLPEQVSRFQSYDINLLDAGSVKMQPSGKVQISIPKPDGFGENLAVYRTEEDGSMTLLDSEVKGGKVIFTTDHFSLYTIAEMEEVPAITHFSSAIVLVVLVVVVGGVIAVILLYKKKKSAVYSTTL